MTSIFTDQFTVKDVTSFPFHPEWAKANLFCVIFRDGTVGGYSLHIYYWDTDWAFFSSAVDRDGKEIAVKVKDRQVNGASNLNEQFYAEITREYLDEHKVSGLNIRFDGKYKKMVVKVPPAYIESFLNGIANVQVAKNFPVSKIGASYVPANEEVAKIIGTENPQGVVLMVITKDSPADKAGLKYGYTVIAIDGKPVQATRTGLDDALNEANAGSVLSLTIRRGKKESIVQVTL